MVSRFACRMVTVCAAVLAAGCGEPVGKETMVAPQVDRDTVVFPAQSLQRQSITTEAVRPRRNLMLRFTGRLVWNEDRTVRVFSPFAGRVLRIDVRPGDVVRAGQTLALVAAPELGQAQSEARRSEQDLLLAQKNVARVTELHANGVAPTKDLQAAQADLARAEAERSRTLARLKLYGGAPDAVDQQLLLRSPIAGVVVERNLNPGQELRPEQPTPGNGLFVVSDPSRLWFSLDVAESDLGAVRPGAEVLLRSALTGSTPVTGRIAHIADSVDPQTRTVKARGTVDNADRRLKAEMFITAELTVPEVQGLLVPTKAVYLRGDEHYVFVEAGEGRFQRRRVRLGPSSVGDQVVLEGLVATDKVVVDGNLQLERLVLGRN
ncbi:MAG: efflux RND transporter periplasmic adaptor subunit [Betaproteobacteria bacterium]|nr:efflux RND transporter periplasmic adaptor subunit [Betaproteobacteria bacterium]